MWAYRSLILRLSWILVSELEPYICHMKRLCKREITPHGPLVTQLRILNRELFSELQQQTAPPRPLEVRRGLAHHCRSQTLCAQRSWRPLATRGTPRVFFSFRRWVPAPGPAVKALYRRCTVPAGALVDLMSDM